jgi:hypothetical protein
MAISRAQMLKELLPGLNALFGLEYEKYEDEHDLIYETESSERSFEEEVKLSGFGAAPVKNEGSAISYDSAQESFTARYNRPSTAADLNETSLENAIIDIAAFTDERGLLIAARPRRLIVPPALMFTADRLLETAQRVGTADNDLNAIRNMGAIPEGYAVNHYLTDSNAFFIITDVPNGMKHFNRTPLETSMDGDFDTGNVRYKSRERYSFGVSDPLGIYGSPGSS